MAGEKAEEAKGEPNKVESDYLDKEYTENGQNYRFFLAWRQATFAALITVLTAGLTVLFTNYTPQKPLFAVIPIVLAFVVWIFWRIDSRNRPLYRATMHFARWIEETRRGAGKTDSRLNGAYTSLYNAQRINDDPERTKDAQAAIKGPTHSGAIDWFCGVAIAFLITLSFSLGGYSFYSYRNPPKEVPIIQPLGVDSTAAKLNQIANTLKSLDESVVHLRIKLDSLNRKGPQPPPPSHP